jgi:hypothetical protein
MFIPPAPRDGLPIQVSQWVEPIVVQLPACPDPVTARACHLVPDPDGGFNVVRDDGKPLDLSEWLNVDCRGYGLEFGVA